jgi:hypothetical protein
MIDRGASAASGDYVAKVWLAYGKTVRAPSVIDSL